MLISKKEDNRNPIDGLDVVNVGLSAVLYNTETHEYYTPNTNQTSNVNNSIENNDDIEYNKGNLDLRYNHNHSAKDGRFISSKSVISNSPSYKNKTKRLSKKEYGRIAHLINSNPKKWQKGINSQIIDENEYFFEWNGYDDFRIIGRKREK